MATTPADRPAAATTRALLLCGVVAGPLYVALGLFQMAIREGFDLRRHALSLMSNGPLGWIQVANFLVTGLLVILCAVGIRRALVGTRAGAAGPILLAGYGVGLIGAGICVADPALGFPVGTPDGPPAAMSTHGVLHFVWGAVGFYSLIAACFVFASRFSRASLRGWKSFSIATGLLFFASFAAIASGRRDARINIAFSLAVVLAWSWVTAVAAHLRADVRTEGADASRPRE